MVGVERVDILGCPFDAIAFEDMLGKAEIAIKEAGRLQIVPGNVDFVMKARRDPEFRKLLAETDLIIADGVPITWAAAAFGTPLRGRVSGTDMVWRMGEISQRLGVAVAFIGAAPGIAQRAADKMTAAFPGARLIALPTPMPLDRAASLRLAAEIRTCNAKVVLAALGAPRQERWIHEFLDASGANVGAGIGSAFDIISGDKPRAPAWMADNGLEWLHRLFQEPQRLGRRYLIEDSPFFLLLMREVVMRRFRRISAS